MGGPLRRSTSATRNLGPFVDDTDFKTLENGLTIVDTEVRISKNGATFAPATGAVITFNENGFYDCTFAVANVDTGGSLEVQVFKAGTLIVYDTFTVYTEAAYDFLFAGTASTIDANVTQYLGTGITETSAGRIAGNHSTFWDNGDATTTKIVDDVGGAGGGTVDANLVSILGETFTETTPGLIADNWSDFFNNGDATTTKIVDDVGGAGGGTVDANLVSILGETFTETTPGLIADNWSDFFNNGGSVLGGSRAGSIELAASVSNESIIGGAYGGRSADSTTPITVDDMNQILLSMALGRFVFDKNTGETVFYANDSTSELFRIKTEVLVGGIQTERTRVSYTPPPLS